MEPPSALKSRFLIARTQAFGRLHSPARTASVAGMTVLKALFDGKVFIPDEPVELPVGCALEVHVRPVAGRPSASAEGRPLLELLQLLQELPDDPHAPTDGASQ